MKGKFNLNTLLVNNKFILLFSVIAAVTLWIFVSPDGTRTINEPVNVDIKNTAV